MDYNSSDYDGLYQAFHHDVPVYQGQPMSGDFDMKSTNAELPFSLDSFSQDAAFGAHSSMQRFLKDRQRAFFNPMPQAQLPGLAQPGTPIPQATSHGRQGSPFSSNEPSSCSGALSPPAETEFCTESMSSPADIPLFAPYPSTMYETFEPQNPMFLTGTGDVSTESQPCVSMGEVNPAEETQPMWEDIAHTVDFTSPQRSFTYGSQASSIPTDMDVMASHEAADHGYTRMVSPEELPAAVRGEIQVRDQASVTGYAQNIYPTPSIGGSEDDSEAEINVAALQSDDNDGDDADNDDDDDGDYRPGKKQISILSARRTIRTKRDAPRKTLEGSVSKRARTTPSVSQPAKILPPASSGGKGPLACPGCTHSFKDDSTLQVHIKKQHTRPFICVFTFAGCRSTFASKNEWKRHVMSQHLLLHYWLCDLDVCANHKNDHTAQVGNKRSRGTSARRAKAIKDAAPIGATLPDGSIFNRKDLYTQHLRRMHIPSNTKMGTTAAATALKKAHASLPGEASSCTSPKGWDDHIKALQSQALRARCQLPTRMDCPAPHCGLAFTGADAWDQRMEHVAKHLERAATGEEEPVVFGGPSDPSLMAWTTGPEVAVVRAAGPGRWVLNNPLRAAGESRGAGRKGAASCGPASPALARVRSEIVVDSSDEDAEGEEE